MLRAELTKLFPLLLFLSTLFSVAASAQNLTEINLKISRAVEDKNYQSAVSELQNLRRTDEKTFTLNNYDYLLARMAERQGDFALATANYQAVAARNSILSEYALWHLAQIFRASGNLFIERIYLQKLLTLAPKSLINDAANARLLKSRFESKDYQAVISQLSVVRRPSPVVSRRTLDADNNNDGRRTTGDGLNREMLVLLGQAFLQSGKTAEAQEIFTRLTNELPNPAQPDDYALAGARALDEIAVGKDNFGKAAPALLDAEHFRRASIYQFNRSFALARLHYLAIVEKYPSSPFVADALYQTGRGFAQDRNFDQAINWFERVQAEFPDQLIARDALSQAAAAYARVNKPKEAISRYQKFIERYADAENLDRAYLNIVDVLRDTGANAEALKWTLRTQETFRGKLPEAVALFAQARIHISQNDWTNALADLNSLQNFSDLGGTRVAGGTNKAEITFLKGFALENLNRYTEAIDVYLSIPDGRSEYYGGRATERLKVLAGDEKTQSFTAQKLALLLTSIENGNAEAQRKSAQAVLRLSEYSELRAKMLEVLRKSYAALPEYQKIPNGKFAEIGRREILKNRRENASKNYHQILADEFLFLGLYDEAAPELESGQQSTVNGQQKVNTEQNSSSKSQVPNPKSDFDYTLAVFYRRGDMAYRAAAYIEPLWKNIPADFEIEMIPREQLELLYPAPYSDALLRYAAPRAVDARFILAIMRQESRFRPDVKSNAAARGLMQFISTTSDKIAGELNRENFKQDELYNPPTAILFGAQYLSDLFTIFPNQPAAVAASYNGGEDNMARWLSRSKSDDASHYIPEIIFSQSKDYVYKVMAGYRVYQFLYDENLNGI